MKLWMGWLIMTGGCFSLWHSKLLVDIYLRHLLRFSRNSSLTKLIDTPSKKIISILDFFFKSPSDRAESKTTIPTWWTTIVKIAKFRCGRDMTTATMKITSRHAIPSKKIQLIRTWNKAGDKMRLGGWWKAKGWWNCINLIFPIELQSRRPESIFSIPISNPSESLNCTRRRGSGAHETCSVFLLLLFQLVAFGLQLIDMNTNDHLAVACAI